MIGRYFSLSSSAIDILGDFDLEFRSQFAKIGNNISDCPGGNPFILTHFGQCVSDTAQWASFVLGFISLSVWFFPSIPQIYENYRRGSCDGLSPTFLFLWFFGDTTNLIGALLTHQLPLQIYVGGYYIVQDCIILSQYIYYTIRNRSRRLLNDESSSNSNSNSNSNRRSSASILNGVLLGGVFLVFSGSTFYHHRNGIIIDNSDYGDHDDRFSSSYRSRVLLAPIFNGATDEIGFALGSVSAISYLSGRIPQLIRNHRRRSTEGVSLLMYALICLGNATYGAGVLLGMDGDPWTYYLRHMPWLAGSLSCLLLDGFVFVQYFRYDRLSIISSSKLEDDTQPIIIIDTTDQQQQLANNTNSSSDPSAFA